MKIKFRNELLFRKAFIPWYDTELVMLMTLVFSVVVLLFSMVGVAAALDDPCFQSHIWVPCLLGSFSMIITISTLIRLMRRWSIGGD
ncbi:hypothetical protein DSCO28_60460 [Desulfosarcina ovata subsp. sediminis]|uniref:Uncharacterized protein n=1 Tax=Desulfosarcina ovata subsp. sediminis TaxID=885957 RepID=A0A5K7ZZF0_9BACT|nr:hypothetical protein [Desulfosarcina ovata]BBO85480.1 hypothetical protein DSCO28_60460 [Desulfosarcina ovata subsp. sediminis]